MRRQITEPQRRVLQHVADKGPLTSYWKDWREVLPDRGVRDRLWLAGLLSTPNMNRDGSGRWEITDAGREALRLAETIEINGKVYRRFIPYPGPVRDGTVRCIRCGQIDEPGWHVDELCVLPARPDDRSDDHRAQP